jgi:hypothetical protein
MTPKWKKGMKLGGIGLLAVCVLFAASGLYSADEGQRLLQRFGIFEPEAPLLPSDVTVAKYFVPGRGAPIGTVQKVQGKVYVIHEKQKTAYPLKADHTLHVEDTLITGGRSRLNAVMNDKSMIAMAPQAKLVLAESEYDPDKNVRSSVMGLLWGSVRFLVKKISGEPNYVVKTPTAVCGVRGTDFAVSVSPGAYVSALDRAVASLAMVRPAHAQAVPGALTTTVVTGTDSTVSLAGTVGAPSMVGSTSVAAVTTGFASTPPFFVGASAALGVLNAVGPGLATLAMPPWME